MKSFTAKLDRNSAPRCDTRLGQLSGVFAGVTLTEVLMAMLIASIGLVAVMTLFPVAVLRSVQATQLTRATELRYNAEALINIWPNMVHDPDGDALGQPAAVDPLDPKDPGGRGDYAEHLTERFIVDPLGWWTIAKDYQATQPDLRLWFGNEGTPKPVPLLRRYNAGLNPKNWTTLTPDRTASARNLASLPDSWILEWEGVPAAVTGVSVTLPLEFDATNLLVADSRVVVFDTRNGRSGQIREPLAIGSPSPAVLQWSNPLPKDLNEDSDGNGTLNTGEDVNGNGVLDNNVGRVRIETREDRYTWLLTVRSSEYGQADVDVVVVFRRGFNPEEEQVYDATFIDKENHAWVMFQSSHTGSVQPLPEPFVKKGGFVLDVVNARWYRIVDYEQPAPDAPAYQLRLTLDLPVLETSGDDTDLDGAVGSKEKFGAALFLRGVVEVYPIGKKDLPRDVLQQLSNQ